MGVRPAVTGRVGPVSVLDDREDVLLADDEELIAVDLELGPGVLRVEDLLAFLDVHRLALAVVEDAARAGREDGALLRLLLGRVRQDDTALRHLLAGSGLDDDAVAERLELGCGRSGGRQRDTSSYLTCCWGEAGPRSHAGREADRRRAREVVPRVRRIAVFVISTLARRVLRAYANGARNV